MTVVKKEESAGLSWEIDFDSETNILTCISSGVLTSEALNSFSKSLFKYANQNNINSILLDHSKTKSKMSFMDMYNRYKVVPKLGLKNSYSIAFVMHSELKHLTNLFETIFVNRGYDYKSCDSIKEAKEWLLKQQ